MRASDQPKNAHSAWKVFAYLIVQAKGAQPKNAHSAWKVAYGMITSPWRSTACVHHGIGASEQGAVLSAVPCEASGLVGRLNS
jgi:hypothetical protein